MRNRVGAIWRGLAQSAVHAREEECASVLLPRSGQLLLRVPREGGWQKGCPEAASHDAGVDGEAVVGITVGRGGQGHRASASAVAVARDRLRMTDTGAWGQLTHMMYTGCARRRGAAALTSVCVAQYPLLRWETTLTMGRATLGNGSSRREGWVPEDCNEYSAWLRHSSSRARDHQNRPYGERAAFQKQRDRGRRLQGSS